MKNNATKRQIGIKTIALFLVSFLLQPSSIVQARPEYVTQFENSVKAVKAGNKEAGVAFGEKALSACPPGSSRARLRMYLAETYIALQKPFAASVQYKLLAEDGEVWVPASVFGIARTSAMLGDQKAFSEAKSSFESNYPDHPLCSHLQFIELNPDFTTASPEKDVSLATELKTDEKDATKHHEKTVLLTVDTIISTETAEIAPVEKQSPKTSDLKRLNLSLTAWRPSPGGKVKARGMRLDLDSNADLPDKTVFETSLAYSFNAEVQLQISHWAFDSSAVLKRAVTFDNLAYGPAARARLKGSFPQLVIRKNLGETANNRWAGIFGVTFPEIDLHLRQNLVVGQRAGEIRQEYSLPALGLQYLGNESGFNPIIDTRVFRGFAGEHARAYDFKFGLGYISDKALDSRGFMVASLGYRWYGISSSINNDNFDLDLKGLFFGIDLSY